MKVLGKTLIAAIAIIAPISLGATAQTAKTNPTPETMLSSTSYAQILSPVDFQSEDINLTKGRSIAEGIPIGSSTLKDFSPASAIAAAGINLDLSKVRLSELKFLQQISLESVVAANPTIANLTAASVGWVGQGDRTLGQLAASSAGQNSLPKSVLENTSIGQFGEIASTAYSKYTEAANQPIVNFLGAADIPLSKLGSSFGAAGTGKVINQITVDRINSREIAAGINPRISSGSNKEPHAPCAQAANNCNALEIRGQTTGVTGSLWMVNQKLKGGSGLAGEIATAAGIREYAGYEIPGTDFKIVAISDDARSGTAQLRLDMRTNSLSGSTPYFIPVLPITVSEKNGKLAFPVEILPVAARVVNPDTAVNTAATPTGNSQPNTKLATNVPTNLPTADPEIDNVNLHNGNIGRAVKTNAINPAIGGLL
jgi:hypothetical protein